MKENLVLLLFQSSTWLIENYLQNQWNYLQNQCWKFDLIKTDGIVKNKKKAFFPVTLKAPFLTLTQITLNFKCYWKDWNLNNRRKYNLYNTKRASNKQLQSWQWVK